MSDNRLPVWSKAEAAALSRLMSEEALTEARKVVAAHDCVIVSRAFWESAAEAVRFLDAEMTRRKKVPAQPPTGDT